MRHFAEIAAVVLQADFLLGDVQFFDVVDHFLFEPSRVVGYAERFDVFPNPGLDRFGACFLVRFDLVFDLLDAVDAAEQVGYQRGSFLSAELVDAVEGFGYGAAKCRQFFVGNGFGVVLHGVGQLQDGRHRGRVGRRTPPAQPARLGEFAELPGIVRENVPVDRHAGGPTYRFVRYEDVDLPSLEPFAYCLTDLVFALAVCGRQLDRQIELLAVERADFDGYLLVLRRGFGLAVACHRFNHHAIIWKRLQK